MMNFVYACIGAVISVVVAFVAGLILYKDKVEAIEDENLEEVAVDKAPLMNKDNYCKSIKGRSSSFNRS